MAYPTMAYPASAPLTWRSLLYVLPYVAGAASTVAFIVGVNIWVKKQYNPTWMPPEKVSSSMSRAGADYPVGCDVTCKGTQYITDGVENCFPSPADGHTICEIDAFKVVDPVNVGLAHHCTVVCNGSERLDGNDDCNIVKDANSGGIGAGCFASSYLKRTAAGIFNMR